MAKISLRRKHAVSDDHKVVKRQETMKPDEGDDAEVSQGELDKVSGGSPRDAQSGLPTGKRT